MFGGFYAPRMPSIDIRPAHADDLAAVAAFTLGTFSWGDYVADSFLEWLGDPDAEVVVAVDPTDRPVGLLRAVMMSSQECWLHAARVDPAMRRQGVGMRLNEAGVAWGRERGALVVRLMVEQWNETARRQVEKLGYRHVSSWVRGSRDIGGSGGTGPQGNGGRLASGGERLHPADPAEAEPAYTAWTMSELVRDAHGLYPIGWSWRAMRLGDVSAAARGGRLFQCQSGWAILEPGEARELHCPWLMTTPEEVAALIGAVVDRALQVKVARLSMTVPESAWVVGAMERARFEITPSAVYQRDL